jgi:hypothetical protein
MTFTSPDSNLIDSAYRLSQFNTNPSSWDISDNLLYNQLGKRDHLKSRLIADKPRL